VRFSIGANVLARCWYSGCSFIVFGMKYVLALFLCVIGCVRRISGIGPGLGSMSPHFSRSSMSMK
jgi:hypothetical protein